MTEPWSLRVRFPVEDAALSRLHARAFGTEIAVAPWAERLQTHSLSWVGAFVGDTLVGFVNLCWDGGAHAFVLDTAVDPDLHHHGIGSALVRAAASEARAADCTWLHVDFEPHLAQFYQSALPFRPTDALLLDLSLLGELPPA